MATVDVLDQPDLFDLVVEVNARIAALDLDDTFSLCEILHQAAARIAPVDAAYVCLYSEEDETLFFPYKWDSGALDEPGTALLGAGPTSRTIRQRRPLIWNRPESASTAGWRFGDSTRPSLSAVHLPLWNAPDATGHPILGVFSVQSYAPRAYDARSVRMLEWLAARGAGVLQRARARARWEARLAVAEAKAAEHRQRMVEMASAFVGMVHEITGEVHALLGHLPPGAKDLREKLVHLCRTCHRVESAANEMPVRPAAAHRTAGSEAVSEERDGPPRLSVLERLTEREMEVLRLIVAGRENAEIAGALFISVATVKFHLSSIYRKLGVSNRVQAACMAQSIAD